MIDCRRINRLTYIHCIHAKVHTTKVMALVVVVHAGWAGYSRLRHNKIVQEEREKGETSETN